MQEKGGDTYHDASMFAIASVLEALHKSIQTHLNSNLKFLNFDSHSVIHILIPISIFCILILHFRFLAAHARRP